MDSSKLFFDADLTKTAEITLFFIARIMIEGAVADFRQRRTDIESPSIC